MSATHHDAEDVPAGNPTGDLPIRSKPDTDAHEDAPKDAAKHSILNSNFPVLLPYDDAVLFDHNDFNVLVRRLAPGREVSPLKRAAEDETGTEPARKAPFVEGLEKHAAHIQTNDGLAERNLALTENADVTHVSAQNPLIDLFYDLKQTTTDDRCRNLLEKAWVEDPLATLKIIFNARSIHLGKGERNSAYKAHGWLAENHPHTLLHNLIWLVRPIIEKKASGRDGDDGNKNEDAIDETEAGQDNLVNQPDKKNLPADDFDVIDRTEINSSQEADSEIAPTACDVRFGVSHGYYKDLLNLLVFAANDQLKVDVDPSALLSQKQEKPKGWRRSVEWDPVKAKELRRLRNVEQHKRVCEKLQSDSFYRALHMIVAHIFAYQLKEDKKILDSNDKSQLKHLSLAAKWAPSATEFHDKHTFVVSTISEILFPNPTEVTQVFTTREDYLRRAREAFRKQYTSPLRKALAVVERDIAANTFDQIQYERVPSLAMNRYTELFLKKDNEHFTKYVEQVSSGEARISGATLLPSTLVAEVGKLVISSKSGTAKGLEKAKAHIQLQIIDGQWKTLVKRIKESGSLDSSIAVCDVSGSMTYPVMEDGTTPLDSAVGLSLLVSEVTAPPFGGGFITFSAEPSYVSVGGPADTRKFHEKVQYILSSNWSMNTDFVAVFEDVILPMALANELKQEDMVKQVFVFSDMQFDVADAASDRWTTSYERIKKKYEEAGYEMPRLVFWNLAADSTSKPVTMEDQNTALVSGYSQAMLKVFLGGGGMEDEMEVVEKENEDGVVEVVQQPKADPLSLVMKAISHKAYSMLEVVD